MNKPTLEQVRDELHVLAIENTGEYNRVSRLRLQQMSNAIDAEISRRGEAVYQEQYYEDDFWRWEDVSEAKYNAADPARRRILYASAPPATRIDDATRSRILDCVPSNWCDPLLTGQGSPGDMPWACPQVEKLLRGIRAALTAALGESK